MLQYGRVVVDVAAGTAGQWFGTENVRAMQAAPRAVTTS
jgi:hypothetical protein